MKKVVVGSILALSATLSDIGILVSASILASGLTAWNSDAGRMWTALTENGMLIPFILAKVVWCVGIAILVLEYFRKKRDRPMTLATVEDGLQGGVEMMRRAETPADYFATVVW